MRKSIGLAVAIAVLGGGGVALAGQAGTDSAGNFIDLNVAVSPPIASTAKVPQGVGVSFDSFTGNRINGNAIPGGSSTITVRFARGFKDNAALFPACQINLKALTSCPRSTQIGSGTAEASVAGTNGAPPTFLPATLAAYNGKPVSGKTPTIIFIASLGGKPSAELDFDVTQQNAGQYGLTFASITFPGSTPSPFNITKFSVNVPNRTIARRVRKRMVKIPLIQSPTSCRGSWPFEQVNTLAGQAPLVATDSQPCVK